MIVSFLAESGIICRLLFFGSGINVMIFRLLTKPEFQIFRIIVCRGKGGPLPEYWRVVNLPGSGIKLQIQEENQGLGWNAVLNHSITNSRSRPMVVAGYNVKGSLSRFPLVAK